MLYSEVICDLKKLDSYKDEWNRLLSRSKSNIFLTCEWVSTCWEFFGKGSSLFVILVKDADDELLGIAPLAIRQRKMLGFIPVRLVEFIGSDTPLAPEYLDFIVTERCHREVVAEMISVLVKNRKNWDVLNLSDIDQNSTVLPLLRKSFSQEGVITWERVYNLCPYLRLPASWSEFLSSCSYNMRRTIKRTRKRLEDSLAVKFVVVEEADSLPWAFEHAARLHGLSRQKKGEKGNFYRKDYSAFHLKFSQAAAGKGWLYLAFIETAQQPIAFRYGYLYEQKYYDYQTGYDPQYEKGRAGWVMLGYVMEDLIKKSGVEFDFLRGGHEYKWHWTKDFRRTVFFCCFQYNLASLFLYLWWRAKKKIKKLLFPSESEVPHEED